MRFAINPLTMNIITLLMFILTSNAQENDIKLFDVNSKDVINQRVSKDDMLLLKHLVYDIIDTAYLMSEEPQKPITLSTERIVTDVSSLPQLSREKSKTVQVVVVKVLKESELKQTIDFSVFKNFPNLKCVYISCEIKADQQQVLQMIKKDKNSQVPMTFMGINIPQ